MDRMNFKTFTWPHNPEELVISHSRDPLYGKDAQGGPVYLGMGATNCTITGSGVFTGALAYDSFMDLEAAFKDPNSDILHLPQGDLVHVYFTELVMEQDSRPEYVHYRFTFRAADEHGGIPA